MTYEPCMPGRSWKDMIESENYLMREEHRKDLVKKMPWVKSLQTQFGCWKEEFVCESDRSRLNIQKIIEDDVTNGKGYRTSFSLTNFNSLEDYQNHMYPEENLSEQQRCMRHEFGLFGCSVVND